MDFELSYIDEENNDLGLTFNSEISLDTITKSSTDKTMLNVYFKNEYDFSIEQANEFYEKVLWRKYSVNFKIN